MEPISIQDLIYGYKNGIFPMAEANSNEVFWYAPDPRAIIPLDTYRVSKSLRSVLNKKTFELKVDSDFESTIIHCAKGRFKGDDTWISDQIIKVYCDLHNVGIAHSVETYQEGKLVGGLYGVAIGAVFFGESMFHLVPNASKVAFNHLMEILKKQKFLLLDTQFMNDNVARYGAVEISKNEFMKKLRFAIIKKRNFMY